MNTTSAALKVPFHRAAVGEEEVQAVAEVIRSGWLTMGAKTLEFERKFASYVGAKFAIAVSSCTAGLHLCLEAIGLTAGDEVLVPTTTFTATAEVVAYFGAKPVLVDVDAVTLNIDVEDAKRKVTSKARAVIPVHFAGQPCDLAGIRRLADMHGLRVIEDAAHALPCSYKGIPIGSFSELTAFSFYATKAVCTGEGGMITTNNEKHAHRMQMMRLHGISRDAWKRYSAEGSWYYEVIEAGYKYNLTDLQAALGLAQLAKCDALHELRRKISERYTNAFGPHPCLQVPEVLPDRTTAWHLYPLRLNLERLHIDRDAFIRELGGAGITVSVHFIPLHLHPYYQRTYGYKRGDLPVAEGEYYRSISLPIYPTMTELEIEYVTATVLDVTERFSK